MTVCILYGERDRSPDYVLKLTSGFEPVTLRAFADELCAGQTPDLFIERCGRLLKTGLGSVIALPDGMIVRLCRCI